jgi:hypothetical protein
MQKENRIFFLYFLFDFIIIIIIITIMKKLCITWLLCCGKIDTFFFPAF